MQMICKRANIYIYLSLADKREAWFMQMRGMQTSPGLNNDILGLRSPLLGLEMSILGLKIPFLGLKMPFWVPSFWG